MLQLYKLISNNKFLLFTLITIFTLIYFNTVPRLNVGYSDSDELITVGYNLGVAHPPGYPIYTGLIFIFTHLPIAGSVAFKAHILSSVLSIISLIFIYKSINLLLTKYYSKNSIGVSLSLISFISTLLYGSSFLVWLYSILAEVFALHVLFVSLLIYQTFKIILVSEKATKKNWYILLLIYGLGLSHHHLFILYAPILIITVILYRRMFSFHLLIRSIAVLILAFVIPNLLLFVYQRNNSQVSWYMEPGIQGWVRHITRKEFATSDNELSAYTPNIDINHVMVNLPLYITRLVSETNILIIVFACLGAYQLWIWDKSLFIILILGFGISGPLLSGVLGWPDHYGSQANSQRLLVGSLVFLPLFASAGMGLLLNRMYLFVTTLGGHGKKQIRVILLIVISFCIYQFNSNYNYLNLSNFTLVSEHYSRLLKQVEPNSVVTCFTDTSCFALLYEQFVLNNNSTVNVIPRAYPLRKVALESKPELRNFLYTNEPFRTFDYITWNLHKGVPVYAVEISKEYSDILGFNQPVLYYVPNGYYGKILNKPPQTIPESDFSLINFALNNQINSDDKMKMYFYSNLIRIHQLNAAFQIKYGQRSQAREELNIAGNLDQELTMIGLPSFFEANRKAIESSPIIPAYGESYEPVSLEKFLALVNEWQFEKNRLDVAHVTAVGALALYPHKPEAHLAVAKTFEALGQMRNALIEYKNTLILDPLNKEALSKVEQLDSIY